MNFLFQIYSDTEIVNISWSPGEQCLLKLSVIFTIAVFRPWYTPLCLGYGAQRNFFPAN